ncbi:MAG TPA: DUF1501 domain-containing protein [Pirellulaceae bacterium]|nr:DUF1501 domain-containing protein [Pirellulaceae bacterium]
MDPTTALQSSRRHFLAQQAMGIGSLALTWLLARDAAAAPAKPTLEKPTFDLLPKAPPRQAQARAMISIFMQGGPSHIDLFDPKPELTKRHLQSFTGDIKYDNAAEASAKLFGSPWKFQPHGECGMELSELLPGLAEVADDITLVRSMHTGVNNHGQSINALNSGRSTGGRPVLGSWLTYALGSEADNLPAYMVLSDPTGLPVLGVDNWTNGWLPSLYQGTVVRATEPRILNLDPPPHITPAAQERYLLFLEGLNREHLAARPGEDDLAARIASYELAAKMQTAAKEALDLSGETAETLRLYGIDQPESKDWGTRCLIARRLVERGVPFVQVCSGNQTWDHHGGIEKALPLRCGQTDRPTAALVQDLKRRGLLETTIVHWGGEMGRLPVIQNEKNIGRDHNTYGFSVWLAGGGFKGGHVHGATDELGHKAVESVVNHYDYHATLLHLFGLEPDKLIFQRANGPGSLIDNQPARVVEELLA